MFKDAAKGQVAAWMMVSVLGLYFLPLAITWGTDSPFFTAASGGGRAMASSSLESHSAVIRPLPGLRPLYNICSMYITGGKQNPTDIPRGLL